MPGTFLAMSVEAQEKLGQLCLNAAGGDAMTAADEVEQSFDRILRDLDRALDGVRKLGRSLTPREHLARRQLAEYKRHDSRCRQAILGQAWMMAMATHNLTAYLDRKRDVCSIAQGEKLPQRVPTRS